MPEKSFTVNVIYTEDVKKNIAFVTSVLERLTEYYKEKVDCIIEETKVNEGEQLRRLRNIQREYINTCRPYYDILAKLKMHGTLEVTARNILINIPL